MRDWFTFILFKYLNIESLLFYIIVIYFKTISNIHKMEDNKDEKKVVDDDEDEEEEEEISEQEKNTSLLLAAK